MTEYEVQAVWSSPNGNVHVIHAAIGEDLEKLRDEAQTFTSPRSESTGQPLDSYRIRQRVVVRSEWTYR